tara:strand:+ start:133 stop:429 length:297 start_codon:yes stop_codon:yes gene_type:complete
MNFNEYHFYMNKIIYLNHIKAKVKDIIDDLELFIKEKNIKEFNEYFNCIDSNESKLLIIKLIENGSLDNKDKNYFDLYLNDFVKSYLFENAGDNSSAE